MCACAGKWLPYYYIYVHSEKTMKINYFHQHGITNVVLSHFQKRTLSAGFNMYGPSFLLILESFRQIKDKGLLGPRKALDTPEGMRNWITLVLTSI